MGQELTWVLINVNWLQEILTLQANKWRRSTKAAQIILIEHTFCLCVNVSFYVTTIVLQLHLDVALELIIFGENRYYRHLKNRPCQLNT